MNIDIDNFERFETRHNGPDEDQIREMLKIINADSIDELIDQTIPVNILLKQDPDLPSPINEFRFLQSFRKQAAKNKKYRSFIGMGYYDCITPPVILRNIFENPGWYTSYTPYQAEISQGRLEALVNFQTMVMDLTGMDLANASLLDEGTAAAEAMTMLTSIRKGSKKKSNKFFVDRNTFPQTIDILKTRSKPLDIELAVADLADFDASEDYYGVLLQYPNSDGEITDISSVISKAEKNDIKVCVVADLLALTILTPPGELGADVVVGSSQRFGVPMGYGGPHAAFFATKEEFKRHVPGRIIGVSVNKEGLPSYRMALQTREQHIRRERATSNICTAQVLLAVMAGMYAVYHGPQGLRKIAERIYGLTKLLAQGLDNSRFKNKNKFFFDTLKVELPSGFEPETLKKVAEDYEINFRYFDDNHVGISLDETCTKEDVQQIINVFRKAAGEELFQFGSEEYTGINLDWPDNLIRKSKYLEHPVFNNYHSEHEMLRYLKRLENKDLSLAYSMISLGSCTMKLNATSEMIPVSWPEFNLHPFAPVDQAQGYHEILWELHNWLCELTGYPAVSLQPNSGAQGEFSGLMVIRAYHESRGEGHRNITLIPSSAHGTNPASAVMAGTKVVIVECDDHGNIDLDDLRSKAKKYKDELAAIMITYPSTHGVFEENIREICEAVHENGGQVYMDGANMNAQVGLTTPAIVGADVCHLNLHKTFCIPHGGGGPGVGPIGVAKHLVPFLPGNPVVSTGGDKAINSISAAPWGSASILPISYAYIAMMGLDGLKKATKLAILNANYIKDRLKDHYPILYTGKNGRAAHEFILDCRPFKKSGIEVEDIAKRLMDYGFHAPTMSFPVPGTLMIEPTESETKEELDRFCEAFIQIRKEIEEVEQGNADPENNVLKNAPHTQTMALSDDWEYPYSREKAVYPLPFLKNNKFWPASSRVDNAYGDRHLFCACVPTEEFKEEEIPVG